MNKLKKTLALIATLAMATTVFAGCGGSTDEPSTGGDTTTTAAPADDNKETKATEDGGEDDTKAGGEDTPAAEAKLPSDGTTLTIMSWNTEFGDMVEKYYLKDNPLPSGVTLDVVAHGVNGGEASTYYDNYFSSGSDIDLYCVEADWALNYLGNADLAAPLEDVGLSESEFSNQYGYTLDIGRDENGVLKGVSWQAAPGGFAYRSDLAETYLGVKTPDEMQAKVSDWDKFLATAAEVSEASSGKTALTTTVGGLWQVFSSNRDSAWVVDNKLVVDESCKTFMNLVKEMSDKKYVTDITQWSSDGSWIAAGQTDNTMGYFVSTWGIGATILESAAGGEGGATYGNWSLCVGPTDYYWGGTWLVASPKCDNANLVADIIRYFTVNEDSMEAYALASSDFVNNKKVMDKIVADGSNTNANLGGQDQFAVFVEAADKIDLNGVITKYDSECKQAFQAAYEDYIKGTYASVDDAIAGFKSNAGAKLPDSITIE